MCEVTEDVRYLVGAIKRQRATIEASQSEPAESLEAMQWVLRELQAELADLVCAAVEQ